jgi:hypothetical protein
VGHRRVLLHHRAAAVRAARADPWPDRRRHSRRGRAWLRAFLALYAAGLGYAAAQPPAAPDLAARTAAFLVLAGPGFATPGTPGASGVTAARAIATFGPPAASYRYQEYEILTWRRGVNLLAESRLSNPLSYGYYLC